MIRSFICLTAATVLLSVGVDVGAHHSNAPHYDATRPVQLEGTVTEFEFVNPHAFLHIDVPGDDGGSVVWDCEMAAAIMLRRRGWAANDFVPGQRITVNGIAARREPHGCSIRSIVLEDGTEVHLQGGGLVQRSEVLAPAAASDAELHGIAGSWVRDMQRRPNGPLTGPGPRDLEPPGSEWFTEEGFAAQSTYDERFDDPSFRCSASSISRAWSGPGTPTEISVAGDQITIRHEFMDTVRTAQFGVREHPEDLTPVDFGHSIAWLEGETLVIDTVGFAPGVLAPHPGILHSDALHIIERLSVDAGDRALRVAWVAEDPKYFSMPFSGEFLYQPSEFPVEPYGCVVENANR